MATSKRVKRSDGLYPCFEFEKEGKCKYGDSCNFSHLGPDATESKDLNGRPEKRQKKRGICMRFVDGNCEFGENCKYRHEVPDQGKESAEYLIAKALEGDSPETILAQIKALPESMREKGRFIFFAKQKRGDYVETSKESNTKQHSKGNGGKDGDRTCHAFVAGTCTRGDACKFLHISKQTRVNTHRNTRNNVEQTATPSEDGKKPCRWFLKGSCTRGDDCFFAHTSN